MKDEQTTDTRPDTLPRRRAMQLGLLGLAATTALQVPGAHAQGARTQSNPGTMPEAFAKLRDKPILEIGMLVFPNLDQIDFTGPFEVLVRVPGANIHVIGTNDGPIRDHKGLVLTTTTTIAEAPELDLLVVTGGPGQQALMQDEQVLGFIRAHDASGKPLFSVCTGALLCGGAGILKGRRATTHWAAHHLLPLFGAVAVDERVVVDGNLVSAAGVTAGIDGALTVAALLRDVPAAQAIQLDIQYAPAPPFDAGTPETAPADVLATVRTRFQSLTAERLETANAFAARHAR